MYSLRSRLIPSQKHVVGSLRTLRWNERRHVLTLSSARTSASSRNNSSSNNRTSIPSSSELHRRHLSSASAEPFINGTSSSYVEDMYESWKTDPNSVHKVSVVQI